MPKLVLRRTADSTSSAELVEAVVNADRVVAGHHSVKAEHDAEAARCDSAAVRASDSFLPCCCSVASSSARAAQAQSRSQVARCGTTTCRGPASLLAASLVVEVGGTVTVTGTRVRG